MRYSILLFTLVMAGLLTGCSKSGSSNKGNSRNPNNGTIGGLAIVNNEYEGFMTELSREWQKPILIHFNADSTVVDYCFFMLTVNGHSFTDDSVVGKILQVGTGNAGGADVTVYFKDLADTQVYNFSPDLSGISGGSNGLASNQFYFSGLTKITKTPASLANNSYWTSDSSHENNSTYGSPWYPDINGVQFNSSGFTTYFRNGAVSTVGLIPNDTAVVFRFYQYGSRVYFYGYNENYSRGIPYWGILSDDGNTINADTYNFTESRVPIYGQTFDYYGDAGNPPVMHRRL